MEAKNKAGFSIGAVLRDGATVVIRQPLASDAPLLEQHFHSVAEAVSYTSVFASRRIPSQEEIARIITADARESLALLALERVDDDAAERLVGEGSVRTGADPRCAELSLSVLDGYRRRGIASQLLSYLTLWARRAGIRRIEADVVATNQDALWFLTARGFRLPPRPNFGLCRVAMEIPRERPLWMPIDLIRRRAHELWIARGGTPGRELDDWLTAEREIIGTRE
jgi:GNAT superfamily N-acetyltransferase